MWDLLLPLHFNLFTRQMSLTLLNSKSKSNEHDASEQIGQPAELTCPPFAGRFARVLLEEIFLLHFTVLVDLVLKLEVSEKVTCH